jgi:hypothetical protein
MAWGKCLSHQIWPHIEKGWQDEDKPIHFFWGLAGKNRELIKECILKNEEWWYVDTGYFTKEIQRYPEPKILDKDKTYFRIIKGGIHTTKGKVGDGARVRKLESQGIDVTFKGWNMGETKHILICPSSETVTREINSMSQAEWIEQVKKDISQYTDREIRVRNKPRPGNQWWNTHLKDELKDCHCLVTNMSLAAVEAVMNKVPAITEGLNVAWAVTSRHPKYVEKPFRPGRKTMNEWINFVSENQFTLEEMSNGVAYKTLKHQNGKPE